MANTTIQTSKRIGEVHVFESNANGFNTNTIFYDDGKEVVAFDAQFTSELAKQAIAFLKTKTQNPIKYLVITHPNPDKFNGIPAFREEGAKVIMSKDTEKNLKGVHAYKQYYFVTMAKMFTEDNYPKLSAADITFETEYSLNLKNGGIVQLKELHQSGISNNQTVALISSVNALVVGDLVHYKSHAWLEGPIVNSKTEFNLNNWVNTLKKIKSLYALETEVYSGRGKVGKLNTLIDEQIYYLKKAHQLTKDYILSLEGSSLEEKKKKVDYQALTKIFQNNFSDYNLPYMISYGAYGLVESIK